MSEQVKSTSSGAAPVAPKETGLTLLRKELPQLQALIGLNVKQGVNVEILALQELEYLQMHAMQKKDILECEPITVVQAVKSTLKNNLSLDPSMGLVYVTTRSVNVGTKAQPLWKKVLETTPTANGRLSINYQCGKIIDHKNPEVRKDPNTGKVVEVSFEYQNSRGRWEIKRWDESDFERWKNASHRQNSRGQSDAATRSYANPLYTSFKGGIDPEFARAKAVSHGLKKLGTNPNELRADVITIPNEPKRVNIDPKVEEQAMNDDSHVDYEEVANEPQPQHKPIGERQESAITPSASDLI